MFKGLRFIRSAGGTLEIPESALSTLNGQRQLKESDPESGGILLGRAILNSADIVLDDVRLPMAGDQQSRTRFYRLKWPAQYAIFHAWICSGGSTNYLGDWHTHPELDPTPSVQDRQNWMNIARRRRFGGPDLFFIIVGQKALRVWEVDEEGNIEALEEA